jgi:hypothetical protein
MRARSSSDLSLRSWICQLRTSWRMAFFALSLIAGEKLTKCVPYRFFDRRDRNVNPKKSNRSCSYLPVRSASLHEPTF